VADAVNSLPQADATLLWQEIHQAERCSSPIETREPQALLAEIYRRRARQEEVIVAVLARLYAGYRRRRNRKRSQGTVQRDAEIAHLRDSEGWIWEHIAHYFGLSTRSVIRAYKRHHQQRS
jgi:hypothetical protein